MGYRNGHMPCPRHSDAASASARTITQPKRDASVRIIMLERLGFRRERLLRFEASLQQVGPALKACRRFREASQAAVITAATATTLAVADLPACAIAIEPSAELDLNWQTPAPERPQPLFETSACPELTGIRKYVCYGDCCGLPWGPGGPICLLLAAATFRYAMPFSFSSWFQKEQNDNPPLPVDWPALAFSAVLFASAVPRTAAGLAYSWAFLCLFLI